MRASETGPTPAQGGPTALPEGPDPALIDRLVYSGAETYYGAIRWAFTDLDSDTLTYWATAEHPGILEASVTDDESLNYPVIVNAHNPGSTTVTYGVYDGYGGQASATVTVTAKAKTHPERRREVPGRHLGGRPGDRDALRRRRR